MTTNPKQPDSIFALFDWSPTLATVVGGLIVIVIVALVSRIPKLRPYALSVGRAIKRALAWIWTLRVTSKRSRESLFQSGYDTRDSEIAAERKHSAWPSWRISDKPEFGEDCYYLYNDGWAVTDVSLEVDPALFVLEGNTFFSGKFGDDTPGTSKGRQFRGRPTELGREQGVNFSLKWLDKNGDEQPTTSGDETRSVVTIKPKVRVIRPAWQVGLPKKHPSPDTYALLNGAQGFIGTEITIDAPSEYFTFFLKRELGDMTDIALLRFTGRPTEAGLILGFNFQVSYKDANGEQQVDEVRADFGVKF